MLDSHLRPFIDPPLNHVAKFLARQGVHADILTAVGFFFSLCAFAALSFQYYWVAIFFIILCRLMDGLDGPLARMTQATDLGGFYDIVSDFIFYSGTIFFFAVGRPDMALAAAFLIFSFMGTGSAFLAFAILAAKNGHHHEKQGKKSFFYVAGLAEGTESIAVLLLICIFPNAFVWIAYIYGAICWMTTLGRVIHATRMYSSRLQGDLD